MLEHADKANTDEIRSELRTGEVLLPLSNVVTDLGWGSCALGDGLGQHRSLHSGRGGKSDEHGNEGTGRHRWGGCWDGATGSQKRQSSLRVAGCANKRSDGVALAGISRGAQETCSGWLG